MHFYYFFLPIGHLLESFAKIPIFFPGSVLINGIAYIFQWGDIRTALATPDPTIPHTLIAHKQPIFLRSKLGLLALFHLLVIHLIVALDFLKVALGLTHNLRLRKQVHWG